MRCRRAPWAILSTTVLLVGAPGETRGSDETQPRPLVVEEDRGPIDEPTAQIQGSIPPATLQDQVMEIVNQERLANGGLAPLKRNTLLDTSSQGHSQDMGDDDFFMHCNPDTGTSAGDRMTAAGYSWTSSAENIVAGSGVATAAAAMAAWMGSSGHRANILTTTRREIGIGHYLEGGDTNNVRQSLDGLCPPTSFSNGPWFNYWTQNFGLRSGNPPLVVIDRELHQTDSQLVDLYVYHPGSGTMRFSNDNVTFSAPEPVANAKHWALTPGDGLKTVYVTFSASATTATDVIYLSVDAIFADGYESGDLTAWSSTVP